MSGIVIADIDPYRSMPGTIGTKEMEFAEATSASGIARSKQMGALIVDLCGESFDCAAQIV